MLDRDQARFFARNGFLRLSGLVGVDTCRALVDATWAVLPPTWRRDARETWRGDVGDSCHVASLEFRSGHLKYQIKSLADHPGVVASFQPPSPVHDVARALIGKPLHRIRVRGLYVVAPVQQARSDPRAPGPHIEAHAAQIIALCYLDDVEARGGGLLVWPGSHRAFYPAFDSKLDYVVRDAYAPLFSRYRELTPVELPGRRGDVVLIHHRLLHSPSINRSDRLRLGFLCDYTTLDYRELSQQAPGTDPFEDWPGLRGLAGAGAVDEPSEYVLRPLPARSLSSRLLARLWSAFAPRRSPRADDPSRTQSTRNKSDASELARRKRPGDVWLSLSDSPAWFDQTHSLDPQGGNLTARGVRVALNGVALTSQSRGDFTARLQPRAGENVVEVTGIDGPLWLRVVEIRLPFADSRVLHRVAVPGGRTSVSCAFRAGGALAAGASPGAPSGT